MTIPSGLSPRSASKGLITFFLWGAASLGSWLLVCGVYLGLLGNLNSSLAEASTVILLLAAPTIGTAQWLVLRSRLPMPPTWIFATLLGALLGMIPGLIPFLLMVWPLSIGLGVAATQWLAFRSCCGKQAPWFVWFLATAIASITGMSLAFTLFPLLAPPHTVVSNTALQFIILGTIIEATSSVITGLALVFLLNRYHRH